MTFLAHLIHPLTLGRGSKVSESSSETGWCLVQATGPYNKISQGVTFVITKDTTTLYAIFHDGDIVLASELEQGILQQGNAKQILANHQVAFGNFFFINGSLIDRPVMRIQIHFVVFHFAVG